MFEIKLEPEELFGRIFNQNGDKSTRIGYIPKPGIQINNDGLGNPVFSNAPVRRAPPLNTLTTKLLEEVDANYSLYKMVKEDPIKIPSTMSWDQIPAFVADIEEERYQSFKPLFFPDLENKESNSGHKVEDHKFGKKEIESKDFETKLEDIFRNLTLN